MPRALLTPNIPGLLPEKLGVVCALTSDNLYLASSASRVLKNSTAGFWSVSSMSQCCASSKQQYRPCSSHRHSPDRLSPFTPFFALCGHADFATTHLQPPVAPYRHVQEFEGRPGRFTVQKIFCRHTGIPHAVVRWPRIHDMHAILQIWLVRESTTSIVLNGLSWSMPAAPLAR